MLLCFSSCDLTVPPPVESPQGQDTGESQEPGAEAGELPAFSGLAGTAWLWGQSLLVFGESTVRFRGRSPDYPYTVSGLPEGEAGGGAIATLGDFVINAARDTLEIINYRNNGPALNDITKETKVFNAVFARKNPEGLVIPRTIVGTEWNVGGVGGGSNGDRFKQCQWIIFFNKDELVNQSGGGVFIDAYTFDGDRRGWIEYINNFVLTSNWDTMNIPSYKQYGHSMVCARVW
jgi:hypothetical protein